MTVLEQIRWLMDEYHSLSPDDKDTHYYTRNMHYGVCFKLNELRDKGEDIIPLKKVLFQYVGSEDNKTWLCPTILTKLDLPSGKPLGDIRFTECISPRILMLAEVLVAQLKKEKLLKL